MGLFDKIKNLFKKPEAENDLLHDSDNWAYLLQEVIDLVSHHKLLKEIFTKNWNYASLDEKDEAANQIRKFVIRVLIPMAGGISMTGTPGIFVYTPCQLAGALAIAHIYDPSVTLSIESAMTVMAVILWGKLGQITWIHVVELIPLPGLGVIVIPFVMGWTVIALNKLKDHYRSQEIAVESDREIKIEAPITNESKLNNPKGSEIELEKQDEDTFPKNKLSLEDPPSDLISIDKLAERLRNGGKILYPAQAQVFRKLVESKNALVLGQIHGFRGVAGSGKTIILANLIPHLFQQFQKIYSREPSILVFHHNTYIRKMLRKEINAAFRQPMNLEPFPDRVPQQKVLIHTLTTLINYLDNKDLLKFKPQSTIDREQTAKNLKQALRSHNGLFDMILIDEGQDLDKSQYDLLLDLCCSDLRAEGKSLFIFYDDLQNIFGQNGNVESKLPPSLNRHFLPECVRTSKKVIDLTFNTCLASSLDEDVKNRLRADLNFQELQNRNLISEHIDSTGETWIDCDFCVFPGEIDPHVERFLADKECFQSLETELGEFLAHQELRETLKNGILILCFKNHFAEQLYHYLADSLGEDVKLRSGNHVRSNDKLNNLAVEPACINIANIWDAKGYDADIVYILNPDEGTGSDYEKRIRFYVSATRAKQFLGIYSTSPKEMTPIFNDVEKSVNKLLSVGTEG